MTDEDTTHFNEYENELSPEAPKYFSDFLSLFHHEIKAHQLVNNNTLHLFILRIQNNDFAYESLVETLRNVLIPYVLSRNSRTELGNKIGSISKRAREKFRNYWVENQKKSQSANADKEGELGELLLYAFLESHLGAPKILSKYEIKTSNNDYIKGADGVHLLKLNATDYQLIFGESKLYKHLKEGISAAFTSILEFLSEKKSGYETCLVSTELFKEAYEPGLYKVLKEILLPDAQKDEHNLDHSFGMFVGFDYTIDPNIKKMQNQQAREEIRQLVKKEVIDCIEHLNKKIDQTDLHGYSFYVYVMPFSDLSNQRRDIVQDIIS